MMTMIKIEKHVYHHLYLITLPSSLLLQSIGEWEEWGNPHEEQYFDYMQSYSPYDNVRAQDYPTILVTAGLHDSRVAFWEPAKWVARLRDLKTDNNLVLLKTDMAAGSEIDY